MSTDEKSLQFYKNNAEKYTAHVRDPQDSIYHAYYEKPAMYALLPKLEGKMVLSIGCGSGEDSIYLKRQGALKSVGIDITQELVDIASSSYPECEFHVMNMEQLNFPDADFDFVYSSLSIHYLENWEFVFKEVFRVLKPGSFFLFSCGHPARFAMNSVPDELSFTLRLEIKSNKSRKESSFTGDYLSKRKIIDALGKDTANIWNMPIGDIFKNLKETGFSIEEIIEPRPQEKMKEIDANTYQRLSKIPEFIIFKAFKPK